jgi:hypothetical protein
MSGRAFSCANLFTQARDWGEAAKCLYRNLHRIKQIKLSAELACAVWPSLTTNGGDLRATRGRFTCRCRSPNRGATGCHRREPWCGIGGSGVVMQHRFASHCKADRLPPHPLSTAALYTRLQRPSRPERWLEDRAFRPSGLKATLPCSATNAGAAPPSRALLVTPNGFTAALGAARRWGRRHQPALSEKGIRATW